MKPKTVAIIQARMASSRLPDKVLLDIAGRPMLGRVVERAGRADTLDRVVVATTTDPSDDAVEAFCREEGYDFYRGSPLDVLDRLTHAARRFEAATVVRLTADCPLIDPAVIDQTVEAFFALRADFAANRLPPPWNRTFPIGLDVEVSTRDALERAWREAGQPHQREHVMPYIYENEAVIDSLTGQTLPPQPGAGARRGFRVMLVNHKQDYGRLRWTVDTPEDLELARQVFAHFGSGDDFSWLDVLELIRQHPELAEINAGIRHKGFRDVDERVHK